MSSNSQFRVDWEYTYNIYVHIISYSVCCGPIKIKCYKILSRQSINTLMTTSWHEDAKLLTVNVDYWNKMILFKGTVHLKSKILLSFT